MSKRLVTLENVLYLAKESIVYHDTPMYSKRGKYRMLTSLVIFKLENGKKLRIEPGFYWDENTIPWIFQWAFPKSGMYAVPALVHDALYYDTTTTQKYADEEFVKWMKALKTSKFQLWWRKIIVRLFGWVHWNRNVIEPSQRCLHNRIKIKIYD